MPQAAVTETEIRDWCIANLAKTVDDPSVRIEPEATFAEIGLDSASSTYFIVELEEWLGIELSPELTSEHPSIADLAHYLAQRLAAGDAATL